MNDDEFYILDARSVVGNCAVWWRPDGRGYTTELGEAGIYTREHAEALYHNRGSDIPVPVSAARSAAVTHVRVERLWDEPGVAERLRAHRDAQAEAEAAADELDRGTLDAALECSPFGDTFPYDTPDIDVALLRDEIVRAAKAHECHQCLGIIREGLHHRQRVERDSDGVHDYRWCHDCTRMHMGPPHAHEEFDAR